MPETGENVAEHFRIARADQDAFACRSQRRAAAAQASGYFMREISPITIKGRKGETVVERDEHPRGDTTLEGLAKLKTPFRKPGTVTAGNASGVDDGAAALIIASDAAEHVNPHGGAIALGHPPGMSGARLALTAVNGLETLGANRAIATMCIGVGQGIAALIEQV